ncbi:unnamed protein product [Vicia faba]|uniref:Elongation factor EFG domain-containing protein n=1 Tax=Vicia faba TaxID=3906 RepID=A0AAV0Z9Z5_VICFA|nr:unnamed protein product [Vicia faba]
MARPQRLLYALCSSSATTAGSLIGGTFHPRYFSAGSVAHATAAANIDKDPWWKESMKKVRNIGILAPMDSEKTTLAEQILLYTDQIHKMHEVRGKGGCGATMDSMDLERKNGITIKSASTYCNWKGSKINIIEHVDFTTEVERALRVVDGAILVLCSFGGVRSHSITVDCQMRKNEVPRITFINQLDQMGADPWKVLNQIRSHFPRRTAAIQVPIGLENEFKGLVDLVKLKAYYFEGSHGKEKVPSNMETLVADKRRELIRTVSEVDKILAGAFLSDETISEADLEGAIRRATIAQKFIPVFMGTAVKDKGVQPLLDGILSYFPCPIEVTNYALDQSKNEEKVELTGSPDAPLVALAFKSEQTLSGPLTYLRIYDGVIRKGGSIFNVNTGKNIKISRLCQMHSHEKMHDIQEAHAGQIVAVFGLECAAGDTFTDGLVKYTMTSMAISKPVIIMLVELKVPTEFQGAVTADLNKRKGVILGNDQDGDDSIIRAHVPLNNIFRYSPVLSSMTQGKGKLTMEYKKPNTREIRQLNDYYWIHSSST